MIFWQRMAIFTLTTILLKIMVVDLLPLFTLPLLPFFCAFTNCFCKPFANWTFLREWLLLFRSSCVSLFLTIVHTCRGRFIFHNHLKTKSFLFWQNRIFFVKSALLPQCNLLQGRQRYDQRKKTKGDWFDENFGFTKRKSFQSSVLSTLLLMNLKKAAYSENGKLVLQNFVKIDFK